jgi:hypothetical protein
MIPSFMHNDMHGSPLLKKYTGKRNIREKHFNQSFQSTNSLFKMSQVLDRYTTGLLRTSAETPTILTEISHGFPQSLQENF